MIVLGISSKDIQKVFNNNKRIIAFYTDGLIFYSTKHFNDRKHNNFFQAQTYLHENMHIVLKNANEDYDYGIAVKSLKLYEALHTADSYALFILELNGIFLF